MTKKGKSKKRKLNKKRFYSFIFVLLFLIIISYKIFTTNITNIYIKGNDFLTDQEIINIAELSEYPSTINNLSYNVSKKLENNKYILSANVSKKKLFSSIYISVRENYPLFYYQAEGKTILYNGDKVTDIFSIPTVLNQIPNTVYEKFLKSMKKVDKNILNRMSEIEYLPNDVDSERFFVIMNDGNYVYLTLNKFLTINKYLDMVKSFNNKKGILYLDSGEYFDIFD
jgi:cell division protein FtsQ